MSAPTTDPYDLIQLSRALLTPLIATIALGIAFAQWWTARNRLKLDLFEKRWAIYSSARTLLGEMTREASVSDKAHQDFVDGIRGAKWILSQEVADYLWKELWKNATELNMTARLLSDDGVRGDLRTRAAAKNSEITGWLQSQYECIDALFDPFLQLDQRFVSWALGKIRIKRASGTKRAQA